jgi:hypothetical protein
MKALLIVALLFSGCSHVHAESSSKSDKREQDFDYVCQGGSCDWQPKPGIDCPSDSRCEIEPQASPFKGTAGEDTDPVKFI